MSLFYRFSLKKCFSKIEDTPPENVDPLPWLMAWFVIIGTLFFFVYWIFAWGVTNGGSTLDHWGTAYGVAVIQDVCICETVKLCIMFVFAVMSAKPQLQVIKRVINDVALSLIQDGNDHFRDCDINIAQHFSPSCRSAHMMNLKDLPSAAILRYL